MQSNYIIFSIGDKDLRLPRASAPFRGTTRYASIAALRQTEQSRKDDVESWLYIVVEWTAGSLPWRKLKVFFICIDGAHSALNLLFKKDS